MRVAMISYHTCPLATLGGKDTGGMNVYVHELAVMLGRMGIHVDVYTRSQDEHVPHVVHDLGFGNRVVHVPAGPEKPLPKQELAEHIPTFAQYVLEFASRKGLVYDAIHSHYWMSGIAGVELKKAWNVPLIHMFHTLGLMKNRVGGLGEVEGDYRIRGEREVLRNADQVIAATPAELAQLQWIYEVKTDHVTIIPPGVDLSHFYPIPVDEAREYLGITDHYQRVLFVGRIEPLKGIETLLQAAALMRGNGALVFDPVRISIIGGDASVSEDVMSHEMARLLRLREELDLENLVTFLGKRSQEILPYYYSAADVVVVPSHYESFGMVALEAMACGTPVVASQIGGLAYLVQDGETGFHIPDQQPELMAEKLTMLLNNGEMHVRFGENAARYAQKYSWEIITEQILKLYQSSINIYKKEEGRR